MRPSLKRFLADESGATAIEYGLIVAAISVVLVTALVAIGQDMSGKFEAVEAAFPD